MEDNFVDPAHLDGVRATIRHMRDAMQDEGFKPARSLDEVEQEQLARLGVKEEVQTVETVEPPKKGKKTEAGDGNA
jgi:hypothetical protein